MREETMGISALAALAALIGFVGAAQAQYLIIGNDEKLAFDDGKPVLSPSGKDGRAVTPLFKSSASLIAAARRRIETECAPPTST
jgi:hypothetical protein